MNRVPTVFSLLVCFAATIAVAAPQPSDPKVESTPARNEALTTAAWKALEKKDFPEAIAKAERCIKSFAAQAVKLQKKLKTDRARVPNGAVTENEKRLVHQNGLLNDVATCYFIKAKSHEGLKQNTAAIAAYKAAAKFTYARAWDADGPWFWSPAEAAEERLEELK